CPRGRSARLKAEGRRSPSPGRPACRLSLLLPRQTPSPRRRLARINNQTKKFKKGKGDQRENRLKWLPKKLKKIYLQKIYLQESPASDEAEEKEAKSD
ncbi:Hypothetical predicted protein, partial [Marmota monax]